MPGKLRFLFVQCAIGLLALPFTSQAQAPQRILETTQALTDIDRSSPTWAADVCGGKPTFSSGGARYEWTPVVRGWGQYGSVEAASGWALSVHDSDADVPFTHPFGKRDFNYFLVPDPAAEGLLAPNNAGIIHDPDDEEGSAVKAEAEALGITIGSKGVLGVEQDVDLIPFAYRPRQGDRVAVFGRWIIDCGHDNWHSEIHPPLLTAVARPDAARQSTHVDLIANPYLVDQEFENGGILDELVHDLALVNSPIPFIPFIDRVSAQAGFLPPMAGNQVFSFRMRPPGSAPSNEHMLYFRMHLTARRGVIVQPFWVDSETVGVIGLFTDDLKVFPVTGTRNWDVSGSELTGLDSRIGKLWDSMVVQIGGGMGDFIKAAVLARGLRAILYDAPVPPDLTNAPVTQGWAATNPWGQNPVTLDENQPFPLIGWMEVEWRLPPSIIASHVKVSASAVELHLKEIIRSSGPDGARNTAARVLAMSQLVAAAAPQKSKGIDGEWRYQIKGNAGQSGENGTLWLRTSGNFVQGAMMLKNKGRDLLNGTISDEFRVLRLERTAQRGGVQRILLNKRGTEFTGMIEGTNQTMQMRPNH